MCYLIAKDPAKKRLLCAENSSRKHLVELKRQLNTAVGKKGIQLVTISRPTAYGEYAPYTFAKDEEEFGKLVRGM